MLAHHRLTTILAGAAFASFFGSDPAAAYHTVVNTTVDPSGQCLVVTVGSGKQFSLPSPDNSFNGMTLADFEVAAAYLGSAAINYQIGGNLLLYWDNGAADPNCYALPQIVNLRFTP